MVSFKYDFVSLSMALVYKCKACRQPLATCQNTLPHQVLVGVVIVVVVVLIVVVVVVVGCVAVITGVIVMIVLLLLMSLSLLTPCLTSP